MEKFLVVTNDGKDKDGTVTQRVQRLLEERNKICILCEKTADKKIMVDRIPEDVDCAVVIGGDGSFIELARVLKQDIPILGINMGTLGYLTEVETDRIGEALDRVISGQYLIEDRMMLEGQFQDGQKDVALNDIVLTRKGVLRVIHFDLYVNGAYLNSYVADGIIISTPTGSTAYNLSAGGPVVEPTASIIVITPICSHALNTSSIVLSADNEICIRIGEGRMGTNEEVFITFDGTNMREMHTNETIVIQKAQSSTKLLKLNERSFLEILGRKMKGN